MKLRIEEFEKAATEKGKKSGRSLWIEMGGGKSAYDFIEKGAKVGYETAKNIYNAFGEEKTIRIIDFEDETIESLKEKYILVGNTLFGGVSPMEGQAQSIEIDNYSDELLDLLKNGKSARRVYPDWYFQKECVALNKWRFQGWLHRNNYKWEQFAKETGIAVEELFWNITHWKKWTMMDLICFIEVMGVKDFFEVLSFPTSKMRKKARDIVFNERKTGGNE